MAKIVQFIPRVELNAGMDYDGLMALSQQMRPDWNAEQRETLWYGFVAMRQRVNNPRRRQGADVARRGDVLFPPA